MTGKIKLAILISGSGTNMKSLVNDMENPNHPAKPVLVISNTDDAEGIKFAKAKNIKTAIVNPNVFKDRSSCEKEIKKLIMDSGSKIICLAGFMQILSPEFVNIFKNCILNIHPSLLPLFKGLNTHSKALKSGMTIHGATVHLVTEKVDEGAILGQGVVPIFKNDTCSSLADRVLRIEHKLYPLALRGFLNGNAERTLISEL